MAKVEREVIRATALIASVRAVGRGRPYVTALVGLDGHASQAFADERELPGDRPLAEDETLRAAVAAAVAEANHRLPAAQRVRRFTILPAGELPRDPLEQHHAAEIEAMYL